MWLILMLLTCKFTSAAQTRRIVNGTRAPDHLFQSAVSIMKSHYGFVFHSCGGVVIGQDAVLTAKHCVQCPSKDPPKNSNLMVHAGSHDLRKGELRRVLSATCSRNHDIAVLRTKPFSKRIVAAKIPLKSKLVTECKVVGWGEQTGVSTRRYRTSCFGDCIMRYTTVRQVTRKKCDHQLLKAEAGETLMKDDSQFCTVGNRTDSCHGDSGGPLYCRKNDRENFAIYGIVSWGVGCAQPHVPAVNLVLAHFSNWITKIVRNNKKQS